MLGDKSLLSMFQYTPHSRQRDSLKSVHVLMKKVEHEFIHRAMGGFMRKGDWGLWGCYRCAACVCVGRAGGALWAVGGVKLL